MKKESQISPISIEVSGFSHEGRGIGQVQGKTTFIDGALLGETILCEITKTHRRYNEGRTLQVLNASLERTQPRCAHSHTCGGCSLQHMNVHTQIQLKQKALLEQLLHFGNVKPEGILPPILSPEWHYRRRARLGVHYDKKTDQVLVGFREKFSHKVTSVSTCEVLDVRVHPAVLQLGKLIRSLSQFKSIPQVEISTGDKKIAFVIRHQKPLTPLDLTILTDFAKMYHLDLYLQPHAPSSIHKIWPEESHSELTYSLPHYDIELKFNPLDFVQVNGAANHELVKLAVDLLELKHNDEVLDLFCGLGNFSLPIAKYAKKVIGVEGNEDMVQRAKENAGHNHLNNVEFYSANLFKPSHTDLWIRKYDKILIDPPRAGAKEIIHFIPQFSARKIVYVSCNPSTLARDARELVYTFNYQLKQVGLVNMFPHTTHIEAIAVFEK